MVHYKDHFQLSSSAMFSPFFFICNGRDQSINRSIFQLKPYQVIMELFSLLLMIVEIDQLDSFLLKKVLKNTIHWIRVIHRLLWLIP